MDWTTPAIAAAAAIGASALTGVITFWSTRETLKSNTTSLKTQLEHERADLVTQLKHERGGAREDRDQERRKDAYVSLIKYAYWLSYVNLILRRVTSRRVDALAKVRMENAMVRMESGTPRTTEYVAIERAAFFDVIPTPEEQKQLDARPPNEETAVMRALVTAVATDAVFDAFNELLSRDRDLSSKMTGLAVVVAREPKSLAVDDATLADARQEIDDAAKLREATMAAQQEIDDIDIEKFREANTAAALQEIKDAAGGCEPSPRPAVS